MLWCNHKALRLTGFSLLTPRPAMPLPPLPRGRLAPTPTRLRRPRSLRFSSKGSAVSRRRLASPRLAVCCPSGTSKTFERLDGSLHWIELSRNSTSEQLDANWEKSCHQCDMDANFSHFTVMVSPVCTVWPTSRPRSLSSESNKIQNSLRNIN